MSTEEHTLDTTFDCGRANCSRCSICEPAPIVVAFPTIMDGLVLRWYADSSGDVEVMSASRTAVIVHAKDRLPAQWGTDAAHVHELLRTSREREAREFVTHRHPRLGDRTFEPIGART